MLGTVRLTTVLPIRRLLEGRRPRGKPIIEEGYSLKRLTGCCAIARDEGEENVEPLIKMANRRAQESFDERWLMLSQNAAQEITGSNEAELTQQPRWSYPVDYYCCSCSQLHSEPV